MEKFIPYKKLSKKKKRELDSEARKSWGELNPVTRKSENKKAYNRRRARSIDGRFASAPYSCLNLSR